MKIALVPSKLEIYSSYDFSTGLDRQKIKRDNEKVNSFNFFDHDNLFLRKLHLLLNKQKIEINHYKNFKKKEEIDLYYFIGYTKYHPKILDKIPQNKLKILHINEPPAVNEMMHKSEIHKKFDYVFTSNRELVDNKKFFYINCVTTISKKNKKIITRKNFFSCFVAANRPLFHSTSYYEKKIELIDWFEKHNPSKLHLYGTEWDQFKMTGNGKLSKKIKNAFILKTLNKIIHAIYKIPILNKFIKNNLKIYQGTIKNKVKTISDYKFDFCIENSNYPGFMTARIFHSFFAGTVPIYLGADDFEDFIPKNCYINFKDFNSIVDLYYYLDNMSEENYNNYIENISDFLRSEKFKYLTLERDVVFINKKFLSFLKISQ